MFGYIEMSSKKSTWHAYSMLDARYTDSIREWRSQTLVPAQRGAPIEKEGCSIRANHEHQPAQAHRDRILILARRVIDHRWGQGVIDSRFTASRNSTI